MRLRENDALVFFPKYNRNIAHFESCFFIYGGFADILFKRFSSKMRVF